MRRALNLLLVHCLFTLSIFAQPNGVPQQTEAFYFNTIPPLLRQNNRLNEVKRAAARIATVLQNNNTPWGRHIRTQALAMSRARNLGQARSAYQEMWIVLPGILNETQGRNFTRDYGTYFCLTTHRIFIARNVRGGNPINPYGTTGSIMGIGWVMHTSDASLARVSPDRLIREIRNRIARNQYASPASVRRPLPAYIGLLHPQFLVDLRNANANTHWIDMGCGEGIAIENYFAVTPANFNRTIIPRLNRMLPGLAAQYQRMIRVPLNQRGRITGITKVLERRNVPNFGNRLRILSGQFLEEIPDNQIINNPYGRADFIVDVFGVIPYSRPDLNLAKYLRLLKPGGSVYLLLTTNLSKNLVLTSTNGRRQIKTMLQWLESLQGLRVEKARLPQGVRDIRIRGPWTLRIRKRQGQNIRIPQLKFITGMVGNPPIRLFVENQAIQQRPQWVDLQRAASPRPRN